MRRSGRAAITGSFATAQARAASPRSTISIRRRGSATRVTSSSTGSGARSTQPRPSATTGSTSSSRRWRPATARPSSGSGRGTRSRSSRSSTVARASSGARIGRRAPDDRAAPRRAPPRDAGGGRGRQQNRALASRPRASGRRVPRSAYAMVRRAVLGGGAYDACRERGARQGATRPSTALPRRWPAVAAAA